MTHHEEKNQQKDLETSQITELVDMHTKTAIIKILHMYKKVNECISRKDREDVLLRKSNLER